MIIRKKSSTAQAQQILSLDSSLSHVRVNFPWQFEGQTVLYLFIMLVQSRPFNPIIAPSSRPYLSNNRLGIFYDLIQ